MIQVRNLLLIFVLIYSLPTFAQSENKDAYLVRFSDSVTDECGYKDINGGIAIAAGRYTTCFTDTFRQYAVVFNSNAGVVGIDRQQNILYKIFIFDNGPDYSSDGLFRIMKKGKIGYADSATGRIVIEPQYDCAWPFENGVAQVSNNCSTKQLDDEHWVWDSEHWKYIDKTGKKVNKQKKKSDQ